ncbi:hypothetical protein Q7P35_008930 [Cladosporium inversicolor]
MSTNDVEAFDLLGHGDGSLSSWTNTAGYPQLYAQENATQQHDVFTSPVDNNRACATGIVHAQPADNSTGIHDSGLHPVLGSPFQPEVHQQVPTARPTSASTLEDMDRLLLREVAAGHSIGHITRSASRQCGFALSMDDTLLAYRSAYWRAKVWGEQDARMMEEAVHAEIARFWECVAVAMREKGCPEWPPNEVKMRYQQLHPDSLCLRL